MERVRHYVLIFLVASLCVTVMLKIGEIQYLELILAADFLIVVVLFLRNRLRVKVFRTFFNLGWHYAVFLGLAFILGIVALRQNFYLLNESPLKQPLILTVSRMAELFLDVFYMLYLADLYREDEKLCQLATKTYFWVGIAGAIYGLVSFPLNLLYDWQIGTYGNLHRIRGFNNEAGSYGTYQISVCLLAVCMYQRNWLSRRQFYWGMGLFIVTLLGSQSKAAFIAAPLLAIVGLIIGLRGWKRLVLLTSVGLVAAVISIAADLAAKIDVYRVASASYQRLSLTKAQDGNYVMGRVSGAVLAPRMIAAHPLLGLGWGNYPLVRDDPDYRQGTAFALYATDSPSLGPIDYIVELGFPLWFYLTWISLRPAILLRRHGVSIWMVSLALMQPLSNWFGAHLNITYPWVVVGLALGMGFRREAEGTEYSLDRSGQMI